MSSEIYKDVRVFLADQPSSAEGFSNDLFGDTEKVIVVMTLSYPSNTVPANPTWTIDFIGLGSEFTDRYLVRMGEIVEGGMARGIFSSRAQFESILKSECENAKPLTYQALHSLGYFAYSYPDTHYARLTRDDMKPYTAYGDTRYETLVTDDSDVDQLIHDAFELKASTEDEVIFFGFLWSSSGLHYQLSEQSQG